MDNVDAYFCNNYDKLITYCNKYNLDHDMINDSYIKVKKLSYLTGLTEQQLFMYVRRSMWNQLRDEKKMLSRRGTVICYDDVDKCELENKLDQENWNEELYRRELEFVTRMLFVYIDKCEMFNDIDVFILKAYAFTNVTYVELEKTIGVSKDVCKKTMRKFRNELKNNFINWLNDYVNKT